MVDCMMSAFPGHVHSCLCSLAIFTQNMQDSRIFQSLFYAISSQLKYVFHLSYSKCTVVKGLSCFYCLW